ncbi:MAG: tetratricopeptide repeat protein [Thermodesulfobacteriota bacterium]
MGTFIILALIWGWVFTGPGDAAAAAPSQDVLVQQALAHLEQENFEEAQDLLTQAWQRGVRRAEVAYYLGRVNRSLLQYPEAQKWLTEALRLKPDYPEAQLLLADTLLALDQADQAVPYLKQVQASGFQPGQTAFLLGTAAFKQKQFAQAVDYFRQAQAEPALAQDAKFQLSLALAAEQRLAEAKTAMEEVISLDPQSPLAGFARGYVTALDRHLKDVRPFRFYGTAGFDYDSNVTLQPGDPSAATVVSGAGDLVYTQTATFEYNLLPTGPWALWTQYSYYQNLHRRITIYDQIGHTLGLTPSYSFTKARLWFPFSWNYTDVGSDKYFTAFVLTPTYLYLIKPQLGVELGGRLSRKYYWTPTVFQEDDRTARNFGGSLGFYYFIKNQEGYFLIRYTYENDFANGSNWDNTSHRLLFSILYPVTADLKINPFIELQLQPYDHAWFDGTTSLGNPKRKDKMYFFGIGATYNIYKGLELNVHYYLNRDNSNIKYYDYTRHMWGGQLGYRY